MSFFFTKEKNLRPVTSGGGPRKAGGGGGGISPRQKQTIETLHRLGCKACPLANVGPKVEPVIPKGKVDIFFLGEGPNEIDEEKGKPLSGKVGKLLRGLIPDEFKKRVAYGGIVMHRPKGEKGADWVETECCRGYVTAQIEKARPKVIVGLGMLALKWVQGSVDVAGLRGRVLTVKVGEHICYFIPTFHPSFILKTAYDAEKPLQSRMGHAFRMDIQKAFDFLDVWRKPQVVPLEDAKKDIKCFNGDPTSFETFDNLIEEFKLAHKSKRIAIDLETYPLRPFSKDSVLLTAAIAYWFKMRDGKKVIRTFAFALDHPQAKWKSKQKEIIREELEDLLVDKKVIKIAHNAPFELEWLIHTLGTDFIDHHSWHDTMYQASLIDERKGKGKEEDRRPTYQNLDFLCKQYFGFPIKSLFKLNKKDMRTSPIDECLLYNGVDSKYTLLLDQRQMQIISDEGLYDIFEYCVPRQTTVAIMQGLGLPVDQKETLRISNTLKKEIDGIEDDIRNMKVVKQFVKDKGEFNPHSGPQVLDLFQNYLKADLKVPKKNSKNEFRLAVDKGVLDKIDHPLAPAIIRLRNRQKLKSTYADEFILSSGSVIYPDGMLHTSFNTTFTTSGRLSSDDPNLQNFPKHQDKWVRRQVAAPPGHVMVSIDYGQLEWCCACIECKDKVMVDATWTGYDVHMVWAEKIAKRWPELIGGKKFLKDPVAMKKARSKVKNKAVFPLIFGAQDMSVAGYLGMPEDVAKDIFEEFWETFEGLGSWQKRLMKGYYETGYVENKLGRRRRYPMSKNEAINFPIQSLGAEIVVNAMDRLSEIAVETGEWFLHPRLNIHDDLTFIIEDNERLIDESLDIIVPEMLALPYDFVNVPMGVEISIGKNWEDMEDIVKIFTTDIGRHDKRTRK